MSAGYRISRAFEEALRLPLNHHSKYILLSDCHRGIGNANDNFLKNEYLYLAALTHYYNKDFIYLELGDGDELWENRSIRKIKEMHMQSFDMMAEFYAAGRFYAIYGNHDIVKKKPGYPGKNFHTCYSDHRLSERPLFPNITFYPGIILCDCLGKRDIYLTHGHQADPLNSRFWRLARFLVRYIWRPLESIGIPDPTSAAKNNKKKKQSEQILSDWAKQNHHILIAGHTHHPMAGSPDSPYLNTGSCIHPSGITGIEIENRCMTLVKWSIAARNDMSLYASRDVLGKTVCIDDISI